jgi:hypothetical protein
MLVVRVYVLFVHELLGLPCQSEVPWTNGWHFSKFDLAEQYFIHVYPNGVM